jgi:DNA helicase-2/ATP-dependent DNA helicase PcrA
MLRRSSKSPRGREVEGRGHTRRRKKDPVELDQNQQRVKDFIKTGRGSAIVVAVAGSGKTTTIVACANELPTNISATFVAFNKNIVNELNERLPKHVKAQTLNGLGSYTWWRACGKPKNMETSKNKTITIVRQLLSDDDQELYALAVCRLVALAKSVGLVPVGVEKTFPLTRDTEQAWYDLIDKYEVELEEGATAEALINHCRVVLRRSIEVGKEFVDFDDQMYLPVIFRVRFWQHDLIFVDEAQDVNMVQRAMLKLALRPGGRLIAVGDPCQAIYGFRGADTDSIENIKREFAASELPLSVSYRCPQAVVAEAQRYVSHIEAFPKAPQGLVRNLERFDQTFFRPTDGVVCRNTAPLIDLAYKLLKNRKACRVLGREIGQGLVSLVKKMKARDLATLETRLREFQEREVAKAMAKGEEKKAEGITDKVETLGVFISWLPETERTVKGLLAAIDGLFTDNDKGVTTLSTIHKAKGGEYPRVLILNPSLMPSKWARQQWQQVQERNLQYVAITRAQEELYYGELKTGWVEKKEDQ